jgi:hypothetical protein
MKMYTTVMAAHGVAVGINFRFDGTVANTLQAHRIIQHYQEEKGPEVADKIVKCILPSFPTLSPLTITNHQLSSLPFLLRRCAAPLFS